jgi:hypothetical protein
MPRIDSDSELSDEEAFCTGGLVETPIMRTKQTARKSRTQDSNGEPSNGKTTTLPKGSKCEPKDFYPVKPGTDSSSPWTEEYPTWISEAIENPETAAYAILRRHMKSTDTRKKLSLHSVVVQSPRIKKVLGEVFDGYEGVTTACRLS